MKVSALPSTPTLTRPRMKVVSAKPAIPSGTGSAGFQAFSDIALGARLVLVALGSVGLPGPRAGRVATLHKVLLDRTDLRSSCPAPERAPRTGCNGTPHARSDWSGGRGAWCRRSGARLRVPGGSAHLRVPGAALVSGSRGAALISAWRRAALIPAWRVKCRPADARLLAEAQFTAMPSAQVGGLDVQANLAWLKVVTVIQVFDLTRSWA